MTDQVRRRMQARGRAMLDALQEMDLADAGELLVVLALSSMANPDTGEPLVRELLVRAEPLVRAALEGE